MVEQKLPKLTTRVRFPSPAPNKEGRASGPFCLERVKDLDGTLRFDASPYTASGRRLRRSRACAGCRRHIPFTRLKSAAPAACSVGSAEFRSAACQGRASGPFCLERVKDLDGTLRFDASPYTASGRRLRRSRACAGCRRHIPFTRLKSAAPAACSVGSAEFRSAACHRAAQAALFVWSG